jgi:hypothetical protein
MKQLPIGINNLVQHWEQSEGHIKKAQVDLILADSSVHGTMQYGTLCGCGGFSWMLHDQRAYNESGDRHHLFNQTDNEI